MDLDLKGDTLRSGELELEMQTDFTHMRFDHVNLDFFVTPSFHMHFSAL